MSFKNKLELIEFVKKQVSIELNYNSSSIFNENKKVLYTQVNRNNKNSVLSLLNKYGIRYESHIKDNYFIYINKGA